MNMIKAIKVLVTRSDDTVKSNEVSFKIATPIDVIKIYRAIEFQFPEKNEAELITWILDIITKDGIIFLSEVSGRVIGCMSLSYITLQNNRIKDCISSSWLYVHKAYKDEHISTTLTNMAKLYANEYSKIIKLNPKYGVSEVQEDAFFKLQGFVGN